MEGIAVIGMAGRFPRAKSIEKFWQNLKEGVESISILTDEDILNSAIDPAILNNPRHVKAGGVLEDIELFDAAFFGFNPREAAMMDPQHRFFLECAWQALEDAGYDSERYAGEIGIYAGMGWNSYLLFNIASNRNLLSLEIGQQTLLGNEKDFLTTRTSYKLNLKGPSINVQTGCSTSLVAIDLACQSLLSYQCDMALAGGVSINVLQKAGYLHQEGGIMSPDGHCRTFDAKARGTVSGSGVGIVVLKRLEDALADGDCIHAVIKGSAINNDGALKVGYTAPSLDRQAQAIAQALALADIEAETISYVECHGTATVLGDPVEVKALTKAYRSSTQKKQFCAIGSVKSNIGHLDAAAGVAGFIKTVLALKHKLIPPSLHFEQPNPKIDFENSPFYVNTRLSEWKTNGTPRRAGVSSFGLGGTNAHLILEEAPDVREQGSRGAGEPVREYQLLVLSAKTESALETATANLVNHLKQYPNINLADVAYTLQIGRRAFSYRRVVVCQDVEDAVNALQDPKRVFTDHCKPSHCPVVFMFSGQGAQYVNMARELYSVQPTFGKYVDICAEILQPLLNLDIRHILFPDEQFLETALSELQQTVITQSALFVIEYALTQLWMEWGVHPEAMIGHSIGEYVAATIAGVFSLEDALTIVAIRGKLMQLLPNGSMLAIPLKQKDVQSLLDVQQGMFVQIAAINSPSSCVVSGSGDAIASLQKQLSSQGIQCRLLHTSHAFHSVMMEPILEPFVQAVKKVKLNPPRIRFISNVTGRWITEEQAINPNYWGQHLRQTVKFSTGISQLLEQFEGVFLEVGPGRTLSTLTTQHLKSEVKQVVLPSLAHAKEQQSDVSFLLQTLGRLWLSGVEIDWAGFYSHQRRDRLPLPTYPFEPQRYWIEPQKQAEISQTCSQEDFQGGISQEYLVQTNSEMVSELSLHSRPNLQNPYIAPSSTLEHKIAKLYQEVLGIEQVGIYDNFFELGGSSLIGLQVIAQLRKDLQLELSLSSLFEAPSIARLALFIEEMILAESEEFTEDEAQELPLAKQTLLEKRLRGEVKSDSRLEVIPRHSNTGIVPLSFTQQRLWFLHQLEESGSAFYSEPTFLQMLGSLDVMALEQSLNEIVQRHESLRTTFETIEGQPMQVIAPALTLTLPVVNLCHLPETEQQAQIQKLAVEEIQQPFDFEQAPLLRVKLLHLNEQEHLLLFIIHHIVSDGWSLRVLIRELANLYQAFCAGKPSPLPELPIQYADFALWQHQWLQGEVLEKQLSYWKQQLAGAPSILKLPTDRPRPLVQSFRGATITFKLSANLTSRLKLLSQKQGITLFMTLLAAFQTLLYRYSGQEDICVGSPIANRNRNETHGLIGCFVNTLVMRTNFSDNPSFLELLKRVQQVAQDAYAHEDLPFKRVVEELQLERNLSYQPLFQVMFVLQNSTKEDLILPGLAVKQLWIETGNAKFDLSLYIEDAEPELIGWWEYNTDLFDTATMTRMLEHFQILLEGIVTHPEHRVSNLPMLTEQQLYQQLVEWNNTQVNYPLDTCIHKLFEAEVERTPDAVAIVFEDEHLTYWELNKRANQLAYYLQKQGVSSGILVGICVERSLLMVIGLLGILKAGGAYVPFDPAYPQERISFMFQETQVAVVLTQQELISTYAKHQAKLVCLDTDWGSITQESEEHFTSQGHASNLAYVIYTSGSTGQPKGVQITHSAVANFLMAMRQTPGLTERDIFLSVTTITFDIAGLELYLPLIVGARLVLVNRQVTTDGTQLLAYLIQRNATVMQATPATWKLLLAAGLQDAHQLKILCGGEALSQTLTNELLARGAVVWNMYGPTETTIWSTANQIESGDGIISIGCPIANTQLYVLNQYQQPLPIGVSGELHIGGAGLAWGYINRADLTAEKFIPNPFSDDPGARLYKTGDLVRYRQDGKLEFLGRIDHQVKLRGFRIELAEIEAVLRQHQAVREVVVLLREDDSGNKRLAAYIVFNQEQIPTISDLHRFLKEKLPEYMIPSAFVMLEALPLTPNGKVDRRSLPQPDTARPDLEAAYTAPRTLTEKILAKIWSEVLQVEQVGIHDNFFELGGDSVLCIQAIARAKQASLQLTPKQMFQHQSIAELAAVADTTSSIVADQKPIIGQVHLTSTQYWFFEQNILDPHYWNMAIMADVQQAIAPAILKQALQQLIVHHDALRLRFVQQKSSWLQTNADPEDEVVSFTFHNLSNLSTDQQESAIQAAIEKLQASLNLSTGPLIRTVLFNLGVQKPSRLLIVVHHLAIDGFSWQILLEDLHMVYQQLSRSEAVQLPLKTTSFKQWSEKLLEYAQKAALQQELTYWLAELQKPVSCLPVNYLGGKNTVSSAQTVSAALTVEETQVLLQEVPQIYRMQMNDVLLTAILQAFAQWTGESSLLIDLEGDGRENIFDDLDLSRTVGWFTTIFPVRLELAQATHSKDILQAVKEKLRRIPNQGIGYGVLRYLSNNQEKALQLQTTPQAQVIFNYLGQLDKFLPEELMFKLTHWNLDPRRSLRGSRSHMLEGNGFIIDRQLWLNWSYSENLHQRSTIERLTQSCIEALRQIIVHCQSPEASGFTPSDFPDVELSQEKLDKALAEIDFS